MEKKHTEREALPELVEHLDKYERCKNCYHLSSCDVWVRHGTTLYDDYGYSVKNCPYYIPAADVVEVVRCKDCRHAEPFGVGFVCRYSSYAPYVGEMHYCANGWRKNNAKMDGKGDG